MLTTKLKKALVKDFSIPIQIVDSEDWNYYLSITDPFYGSLSAERKMISMLTTLQKTHTNIEEQFYVESKALTKGIIEEIKNTKAYEDFSNLDMNNFNTKINAGQKSNLYTQAFVNKTFYSIDLKKANYQALKYINPELVLNSDSYQDLVTQFTDFEYFKDSKQIRQVIFGNLNPKRQQQVQKHIMNELIDLLLLKGLNTENIISCSSDEIVFEKDNISFDLFEFMDNREILNDIEFHVNCFELKTLEEGKNLLYKKDLADNSVAFKGINSNYIFECIKKYNNQPINVSDITFYHEGRLCQYIKPLFT
jgi:hypothetical protein